MTNKKKPPNHEAEQHQLSKQLHLLSNHLGAVWGNATLLKFHLKHDTTGQAMVDELVGPLKDALDVLLKLQEENAPYPSKTLPPPPTPSQNSIATLNGCEQLLLIEDDLQYADMLTRYFRYLGYEVRIAGNPRDALSLFEREEFDLVLLDHHLPQMTGLEVAQKLREQNQRIRMILLSGELHDGQHELFREVGFYSVLTKTSSLKEVGQTVRESLDAPPPK